MQELNTTNSVVVSTENNVSTYMNKVFTRMFIGLLITFATSFIISLDENLFTWAVIAALPLIVLQLVVVFVMSFLVNKLPTVVLNICFVLYSIITGVTFGVIFDIYTSSSISLVFIMTGIMFGTLAVYGYTTKKDLSKIGSIAFAGLIAVILCSIINIIFFKSQPVDTIIDAICILVFCGMTMYDVQKIKNIYISQSNTNSLATDNPNSFMSKMVILGALTLYLDFINIFLRLLSLLGKARD